MSSRPPPAAGLLVAILVLVSPVQALPTDQDDAGTGRDAPDSRDDAVPIAEGASHGTLAGVSMLGARVGDGEDWYRVEVERGRRIIVTFATQAVPVDVEPPHLELLTPDGTLATFLLGGPTTTTDNVIADVSGAWFVGVRHHAGGSSTYDFSITTAATDASWLTQRGTGYVSARIDVPEGSRAEVLLRATISFDDLDPAMVAVVQLRNGEIARWESTSIVLMGPRASAVSSAGRTQVWATLRSEFGGYHETNTMSLWPGSWVLVQMTKASGAYLSVETEIIDATLTSAGASDVIALQQADFDGTAGASTPIGQAGGGLAKTVQVQGFLIGRYSCRGIVASCTIEHNGTTTSAGTGQPVVGNGPTWRFTRDREASTDADGFVLFGVDLR